MPLLFIDKFLIFDFVLIFTFFSDLKATRTKLGTWGRDGWTDFEVRSIIDILRESSCSVEKTLPGNIKKVF